MGLGGSGNTFLKDLPLFIAFAVLAAYTYSSGLRAPALIAFVKDALIYLVIIVAIVYMALEDRLRAHLRRGVHQDGARPRAPSLHPCLEQLLGLRHARAGLGAGAVHVPALDDRDAVVEEPHRDPAQRRGAARLLADARLPRAARLRGDRARRSSVVGADGKPNTQLAVPHFFDQLFPSWFAGIAFAAIAIGALVPAAIMSIAAANLFTRNIYRDFFHRSASPAHEAAVSKIVSLVVKVGALVVRPGARPAERDQLPAARRRVDPADVPGDRRRAVHPLASTAGRCSPAGPSGSSTARWRPTTSPRRRPSTSAARSRRSRARTPRCTSRRRALTLNIVVALVLTVVLRAVRVPAGRDETTPDDYYSDVASPEVVREAERVETGG